MIARKAVPGDPNPGQRRVDRAEKVGPVVDNVAQRDAEGDVGAPAEPFDKAAGQVTHLRGRGGLRVGHDEGAEVVRLIPVAEGKIGGLPAGGVEPGQVGLIHRCLPAPRLDDENTGARPVGDPIGARRVG
jgi:hypothetical protein